MNRIGWVLPPEMTQPKRRELASLLKVRTGSFSAPRAGVVPVTPETSPTPIGGEV